MCSMNYALVSLHSTMSIVYYSTSTIVHSNSQFVNRKGSRNTHSGAKLFTFMQRYSMSFKVVMFSTIIVR